jgi:VCBS repeat-containing protein
MDTYDESGLATVTITVTQENMAPVSVNDIYTTTQNLSLEVMAPGVLDNDLDGDGDDLTAVLDTPPSNGNLTLAPNGAVIYTPTTDFTGADSFTYHAFDGLADSNVAMVVIDVVEGNAPPVAISNTYTTTKDIPLTILPPGVLINDTDSNGDALTAVIETTPTNGSLTLNLDGSFTYTPTLGFSGTDTFTYRAHDGLSVSNAALVTILVAPTLQYSYIPYVILKP